MSSFIIHLCKCIPVLHVTQEADMFLFVDLIFQSAMNCFKKYFENVWEIGLKLSHLINITIIYFQEYALRKGRCGSVLLILYFSIKFR